MAEAERIAFDLAGDRVVGDLWRPEGPGPHPAVIVAGPMTSVKEQVTGVYAQALAARGIAGLALDHRHYGESGGSPRQYERYHHKIEDLRAGLDWLSSAGGIAGERLGAVGICLGAGYAAWAAADNPRVRALGAVAGYYRDVPAMRARDPEGFQAKIDQGIAARRHYEETGEAITIPAAALEGDAAMLLPETYDYYATPRAGVPNYVNAFAVMSREHFLAFDVQPAAPRVSQPTLMIHSEAALSPDWARRFHDHLAGPKSLHWVESEGQVDFYDTPSLVGPAADRLAEHLEAHL